MNIWDSVWDANKFGWELEAVVGMWTARQRGGGEEGELGSSTVQTERPAG